MDQALKTMIANMPEKTGKSLDQWKEILKLHSFEKHSEALKYLKVEHKVSHGFANTIVSLTRNENNSSEDLVAMQYRGKEILIPIYEALLKFLKSLGDDLRISPKKGSVSIIRKRQFVLIKPATKTRIDLGLKFKDKPLGKRLEGSGPFGTMCSHRVKISSVEELDDELKNWMKEAYEESV
jgi:predicted transport protein